MNRTSDYCSNPHNENDDFVGGYKVNHEHFTKAVSWTLQVVILVRKEVPDYRLSLNNVGTGSFVSCSPDNVHRLSFRRRNLCEFGVKFYLTPYSCLEAAMKKLFTNYMCDPWPCFLNPQTIIATY
jgi:hypothetical protein